MSDILVSSRIPQAKKEAGVAVLGSLGATTSELINSAFDYLLETHQLPTTKESKAPSAEEFAQFVAGSTLPIDWGDDTRSDKEILQEGKVVDYESLA